MIDNVFDTQSHPRQLAGTDPIGCRGGPAAGWLKRPPRIAVTAGGRHRSAFVEKLLDVGGATVSQAVRLALARELMSDGWPRRRGHPPEKGG